MQQASSPNSTALANTNPSQNSDIAANPTVFLDDNVAPQSLTTATLTPPWIDGISGANKLDVGAEYASVSNGDGARIRDTAVGTDKHVVADIDIVAIITMEWCFNRTVFANTANGHDARLGITTAICRWLGRGTARHNFPKPALTLLEAGAMGRVSGIIEAPNGSHAIFPILR